MSTAAWIAIALAIAGIVGFAVYILTRSPASAAGGAAESVASTAAKIARTAAKPVADAYADLDRRFGEADLTFDPRLAGEA